MRFSLPRTPVLFLYGLAAAFLIYWHWRHILDALPFLVVLACPLMHLFMHHGHGHRQDTRTTDRSERPEA
jgi:Flp pilus assembly protein TadB